MSREGQNCERPWEGGQETEFDEERGGEPVEGCDMDRLRGQHHDLRHSTRVFDTHF